jgi:hypothetical protein
MLGSTVARLAFVVASFPLFLKMRVPRLWPQFEDLRFVAGTIEQALQRFRGGPMVAVEGAD